MNTHVPTPRNSKFATELEIWSITKQISNHHQRGPSNIHADSGFLEQSTLIFSAPIPIASHEIGSSQIVLVFHYTKRRALRLWFTTWSPANYGKWLWNCPLGLLSCMASNHLLLSMENILNVEREYFFRLRIDFCIGFSIVKVYHASVVK